MARGTLPIILTSAQQISADSMAVQAVVWYPAASTDTCTLSDNQNNVVFQGKTTTALLPIVLCFKEPISVQGLSLKQISGSNLLLIYPADI